MVTNGTGPRSNLSRDELDPTLDVFVEVLGDDMDSGHAVIHDPDYLEPPGPYHEMQLEDALSDGAEFCCDCFATAWVETLSEDK